MIKHLLIIVLAASVSCTVVEPELEFDEIDSLFPQESIEGRWQTSCLSSSSGLYLISRLTVQNGEYSSLGLIYSNSSCTNLVIESFSKGQIADVGANGSTTGSRKIDLTYSQVTATYHRPTDVQGFNTNSFCGLSNWAVGVAQDITGLNCGGEAIPAAGSKDYDIYYIPNGLAPPGWYETGALYIGYRDSTNDGSTAAKRPTSISGNIKYRRY